MKNLLFLVGLFFIGCTNNPAIMTNNQKIDTNNTQDSQKTIKTQEINQQIPIWITKPNYNGKIGAVGVSGHSVYPNQQEEIAINKALINLSKLYNSTVTINNNINIKRSNSNETYKSDLNANIYVYHNIKAILTDRYKDKDGYLYVRLEKID